MRSCLAVSLKCCVVFAGFLCSTEKYGKIIFHFPVWKKNLWSFSMEKEIIIHIWSSDIQLHNTLFQGWYNFTYIVLNIIVPVFDLGRSSRNVWKFISELRRKPVFVWCGRWLLCLLLPIYKSPKKTFVSVNSSPVPWFVHSWKSLFTYGSFLIIMLWIPAKPQTNIPLCR